MGIWSNLDQSESLPYGLWETPDGGGERGRKRLSLGYQGLETVQGAYSTHPVDQRSKEILASEKEAGSRKEQGRTTGSTGTTKIDPGNIPFLLGPLGRTDTFVLFSDELFFFWLIHP